MSTTQISEPKMHQDHGRDASLLPNESTDPDSALHDAEEAEQAVLVQRKAKATNDILIGGLWFFGGILITAITYSAAQGGGVYVVAWGAIVFGGIQFFKGLFNLGA